MTAMLRKYLSFTLILAFLAVMLIQGASLHLNASTSGQDEHILSTDSVDGLDDPLLPDYGRDARGSFHCVYC